MLTNLLNKNQRGRGVRRDFGRPHYKGECILHFQDSNQPPFGTAL